MFSLSTESTFPESWALKHPVKQNTADEGVRSDEYFWSNLMNDVNTHAFYMLGYIEDFFIYRTFDSTESWVPVQVIYVLVPPPPSLIVLISC
uniref:Uncharacterized protein n=1 Tax=Anopheles atroparvus TaxID=41427 RepID=A0AAG5DNH3_ANOAO